MTSYFHLSGASLQIGTIILPGNWGRIIRSAGWTHTLAVRECALEAARSARFPDRPSRLDSAFVAPTRDHAEAFRRANQAFMHHILYRVTLVNPAAASHATDPMLCAPSGAFRVDWTDLYWKDEDARMRELWGGDWRTNPNAIAAQTNTQREILTLSPLKVEERVAG